MTLVLNTSAKNIWITSSKQSRNTTMSKLISPAVSTAASH
eukprot:CCRYP_000072-RG/>CCRYP_000072-RG protein AED:0.48 eAED:0.48 QI:0/-1/0/1/-1/0/1/0/39